MKIKSIKVRAKHLKNAEFIDNCDCPLARALKEDGFKDVVVTGYTARGSKQGKKYNFEFQSICDRVYKGKPFTVELIVCQS